MTQPLLPPEPMNRRSMNIFRGVIAASLAATALAAAIGTVVYTRPLKAGHPRAAQHALHTLAPIRDDLVPEGFSWGWPAHLVDAVRMFQCWPTLERQSTDSVVVWTNGANSVVAFGTALEGMPLPAYASALRGTAAFDAGRAIQVSDRRHVVAPSGAGYGLQLRNTRLVCAATSDD